MKVCKALEIVSDQAMTVSEYYTPDELATKTHMSRKWVEAHTQARRIPGQKQFGRSWRYLIAAVEAALQKEQFLLPAKKPNEVES